MKISIIIPTYNEEKYIGDSLTSLKKLSVPHEVIVTDDKSTDKTVEIARSLANTVLVPEKKHRSISENRNDGAKAATGEFLVFMDGDTRIVDHDTFFNHALARFNDEQDLVALVGPLHVQADLRTMGDSIVYFFFNLISVVKNNFLHNGEGSGKFQIHRRDAFIKVGGFREDLIAGEDADMILRLSKIGKTRYDPKLGIVHSGRRAHKIGWPKLLWIWTTERVNYALFNKSIAKEWVDIR